MARVDCNYGVYSLLGISLLALGTLGCAEKKAEVAAPKATTTATPIPDDCEEDDEREECKVDPIPGGSSTPIVDYDVCKALSANSEMKGTQKTFLTELCTNGKLEELRTQFYKGSGSAKINVWSDAAKTGNYSEVLVGSSMLVPTTPSAYFAMTKLQMTRPSDFKAKGFATNPKVTYTPQTPTATSVKYKYNFQETQDRFIEYEATTNFVTFESKKAYLISTSSDAEGTNIQTFRGIIAIAEKGTKTEVFAVSFQSLNNDGDHPKALADVKARLGEEQVRMYTNSKDATKAE